ncbi:excalibur calcium-binding domain-containing protein [Shewanella canadensis]|uniref:Excalibur calcium-binding domain-containing protein n=1 Tax=Shewanella canadensis TaxID=271096 RepID=A0A3S0IVC8_9GAMM|nr:excalibur calcium-binding domain-containing protein [Shewanella canadensis]
MAPLIPKMDGDGDGIPCERQHCGYSRAKRSGKTFTIPPLIDPIHCHLLSINRK